MTEQQSENSLREYLPKLLTETAEQHGGSLPPLAAIEVTRVIENAMAELYGDIDEHKGLDKVIAAHLEDEAHPSSPYDLAEDGSPYESDDDFDENDYATPTTSPPSASEKHYFDKVMHVGAANATFEDDVKPPALKQYMQKALSSAIAGKTMPSYGGGLTSVSISTSFSEVAMVELSGPLQVLSMAHNVSFDIPDGVAEDYLVYNFYHSLQEKVLGAGLVMVALPTIKAWKQDDGMLVVKMEVPCIPVAGPLG